MRHGIRQGLGICIWRDGSKYDGKWVDGTRFGQGIFTDSQGNKYDGFWKDDKKHGAGILWMEKDGQRIIGRWVDGTLQGTGKIIYVNGREEEAKWRDGILVIDKAKVVSKGRSWSAGTVFNVALVTIGVGFGIGAIIAKDKSNRSALLAGAGVMYAGQLLESFCSHSWSLLSN